MGGVEGLEHLRNRAGPSLEAEPSDRLGHAGNFMAQRLQQPTDAVAMLGRAEEHGRDQALRQFARQVLEDNIARRLHLRQQLFHQCVVVVRKLLQHGEALALLDAGDVGRHVDDLAFGMFLVDEGTLQREIDEPRHDGALHDRQLA